MLSFHFRRSRADKADVLCFVFLFFFFLRALDDQCIRATDKSFFRHTASSFFGFWHRFVTDPCPNQHSNEIVQKYVIFFLFLRWKMYIHLSMPSTIIPRTLRCNLSIVERITDAEKRTFYLCFLLSVFFTEAGNLDPPRISGSFHKYNEILRTSCSLIVLVVTRRPVGHLLQPCASETG